MKKLLLLIALALHISMRTGAAVPFIEVSDLDSWETVIQLAENKKSLIYVYVGSRDCDLCKEMRNNALSDRQVEKLLGTDYLPVYINAKTAFGQTFAAGFGVTYLPASLWMTGSEFVWKKEEGVLNAGELITATRTVERTTAFYPAAMDSALNRGALSPGDWMELFTIAHLNRLPAYETLLQNFRLALDWDSLRSPAYWPFVQQYVVELTDPIFQYIRLAPDSVLGDAFPWEDYYGALYDHHLNRAIETKDTLLVETIEIQLLPLAPGDTTEPEHIDRLRVLALWQEFYAATDRIAEYREITGSILTELEAGGNLVVEEVNTLFDLDLSQETLDEALEWIKAGLEHEETVGLYIVKADIEIVNGRFTDAKESLVAASRLEPTSVETAKIRYLEYVLNSLY